MSTTGIDYGLGRTNIDATVRIRYGVISTHTPMPDSVEDIYTHGENLSHAAAVEDAKQRIKAALEPVLDDLGVLPSLPFQAMGHTRHIDTLASIVDGVWESIEQEWNDRYEESEDTYRYEADGYVLETSSLGIYVIKAPFYTFAAFCSPCAPGAGDLNTPRENGVKTFCLGPEWFEDDKAPYPVYRCETDELV